MKQLIIGFGEVGQGLSKVIEADHMDASGYYGVDETYEVLHICFGYSDKFKEAVANYQEHFKPTLTIIHSSVPVGTSELLKAVHSPIRGVHPYMEQGIRTFVKYFGGEKAESAAKLFPMLKTMCVKSSRDTEALKLWDTTQYGVMILLEKSMYAWCEKNDIDFDLIYTEANKSYNEGYTKLGRPDVVRPYLKHMDGKIGGHCVVQNAFLLDSPTATEIITINESL